MTELDRTTQNPIYPHGGKTHIAFVPAMAIMFGGP